MKATLFRNAAIPMMITGDERFTIRRIDKIKLKDAQERKNVTVNQNHGGKYRRGLCNSSGFGYEVAIPDAGMRIVAMGRPE